MIPVFSPVGSPPDSAVTGYLVSSGREAVGERSIPPEMAALRGFEGEVGTTLVISRDGGIDVLVGAGPAEAFGPFQARRAGAALVRAIGKATSAAFDLRGAPAGEAGMQRLVQAVVEGVGCAAYRFEGYRSKENDPVLASLVISVDGEEIGGASRGIERGAAVVEAVTLARDLVNRAPGDLTPSAFADEAVLIAQRSDL
ncbi:MAG: M17 family peptidase N-terminal domain-containing protein, partial [Acidimicrobiales bacterium]